RGEELILVGADEEALRHFGVEFSTACDRAAVQVAARIHRVARTARDRRLEPTADDQHRGARTVGGHGPGDAPLKVFVIETPREAVASRVVVEVQRFRIGLGADLHAGLVSAAGLRQINMNSAAPSGSGTLLPITLINARDK